MDCRTKNRLRKARNLKTRVSNTALLWTTTLSMPTAKGILKRRRRPKQSQNKSQKSRERRMPSIHLTTSVCLVES